MLKSEKSRDIENVKKVNEILDMVNRNSFFSDTYIASGHNTVTDVLLGNKDVLFLIEKFDTSIPLMIKWLVRKKATQQPLIVYFIVFKVVKSIESIPCLVDYINSVPESEREAVLSPWHPFLYAVEAIMKIMEKDIATSDIKILFDQRVKIVNEAKNWYDNYYLKTRERNA